MHFSDAPLVKSDQHSVFQLTTYKKTGDKKTCHCFKVIFDVKLIDESLMLIDRPIYRNFECMSRKNMNFKTK